MELQTLVKPYVGKEFQATIIAVHDFGGARGLEAKIEYESVSGRSWAWLRVSQMIPQREWESLAIESQNTEAKGPRSGPA